MTDIVDDIGVVLTAFAACEVGKHPECGAVEEIAVRCQDLLQRSRKEIEYLRALAGAVTAGAGNYRGVIDAMKEFPRLAGSDYRTIVRMGGERDPSPRHDLCGNE